jgi:hypothetical protein
MTEETNTTTTTGERAAPCFVRHPDAGGQCWEPGTAEVYGIDFCEVHGAEARIGAFLEEYHDAELFFERFTDPHVPGQSTVIQQSLELVLGRLRAEGPKDKHYQRALVRAYSAEVPEKVRAQVPNWILDDGPGYAPVVDTLLAALMTLHKLIRTVREDDQFWLIEKLEQERQSVAAQAAVALEDLEHEKQAPAGA